MNVLSLKAATPFDRNAAEECNFSAAINSARRCGSLQAVHREPNKRPASGGLSSMFRDHKRKLDSDLLADVAQERLGFLWSRDWRRRVPAPSRLRASATEILGR